MYQITDVCWMSFTYKTILTGQWCITEVSIFQNYTTLILCGYFYKIWPFFVIKQIQYYLTNLFTIFLVQHMTQKGFIAAVTCNYYK